MNLDLAIVARQHLNSYLVLPLNEKMMDSKCIYVIEIFERPCRIMSDIICLALFFVGAAEELFPPSSEPVPGAHHALAAVTLVCNSSVHKIHIIGA
jgi:hypothetical protein